MYFLFKNKKKPFSIDNKKSWKDTFLSFGFIFFTFIFVISVYLVLKSKPVLTIKYVQTLEQNEEPNGIVQNEPNEIVPKEPNKDDVINKTINGHVYGKYKNEI